MPDPFVIANYAMAWVVVVFSIGCTLALFAGVVWLYRQVFKR